MFRFATSLSARHGTIWVARWDRSWRVVPHDFDGRELAPGFPVAPEDGTRVDVRSIAVDEDRRLWIVDAAADRVRAFTAFGREIEGLPRGAGDRVGSLADVVAIDATGVEDSAQLAVAAGGARRHALHLVGPEARAGGARQTVSLRPRDTGEGFAGLGRVAFGPRGMLVACEPATGLVHVWRDGRFHFAFPAPQGLAPTAVRALDDGRIVVAGSGAGTSAIHLVDAAGRPVMRLVAAGEDEGGVSDPEDLALDVVPGSDRSSRLVVADLAGTRIQVFNLEGDCYGAFGVPERADERAVEPS